MKILAYNDLSVYQRKVKFGEIALSLPSVDRIFAFLYADGRVEIGIIDMEMMKLGVIELSSETADKLRDRFISQTGDFDDPDAFVMDSVDFDTKTQCFDVEKVIENLIKSLN